MATRAIPRKNIVLNSLSASYGYQTTDLAPVDTGMLGQGSGKGSYSGQTGSLSGLPAGTGQMALGMVTGNPLGVILGFAKAVYNAVETAPEAFSEVEGGVNVSLSGYSPAADSQAASVAMGDGVSVGQSESVAGDSGENGGPGE